MSFHTDNHDSSFHRDRGAILLPPKPQLTPEGFLRCYMRIARVGELKYRNDDGSERIEVVSPEVLFSKTSMDSFKMKPITYPHPPVRVTAANAMQYQRGLLGHYAIVDGDFLGFVGTVTDKVAVDALLSGEAREASCGYGAPTRLRSDGKHDQLDRLGNHTAIVPAGRAGFGARFHVDATEDEMNCWYQMGAIDDLYHADSTAVQAVFKDIQPVQIWDLAGLKEQSTQDAEDAQMPTQIAFPSGVVYPVDDDKLAGEILALIASSKECDEDEDDDDEDKKSMELWQTLGYDSADAAVAALNQKATTLQSKLDAAEGNAIGLQARVDSLNTELQTAQSTRMDADSIATEISARADVWDLVEPMLKQADPNFKRDNKLDVPGIQKLAIAKKVPGLNLDGKSADFIQGIWATIAPSLKQTETRQDSSEELHTWIEQVQRQDGDTSMSGGNSIAAKRKARSKTMPGQTPAAM